MIAVHGLTFDASREAGKQHISGVGVKEWRGGVRAKAEKKRDYAERASEDTR